MESPNKTHFATATAYEGMYGPENRRSYIIDINLREGDLPRTSNNKKVFVLVDTSGSMALSMSDLKKSLYTFRDCIIGDTTSRVGSKTNSQLDTELRDSIDLKLISFGSSTTTLWSTSDRTGKDFDSAVDGMRSDGFTDIATGLKEVLKEAKEHKGPSWVVIMSDGEPNRGFCTEPRDFCDLIRTEKQTRTKIYCLGYGDGINNKCKRVLKSIGEFIRVNTMREVSEIFGMIAMEILSASKFDIKFNVDGSNIKTNKREKIIIGRKNIGLNTKMFNYHTVLLPHGDNTPMPPTSEVEMQFVEVTYTDIETLKEMSANIQVRVSDGQIPREIITAYFDAASTRYLNLLKDGTDPDEVARYISTWEVEECKKFKRKVNEAISSVKTNSLDKIKEEKPEIFRNSAAVRAGQDSSSRYDDYSYLVRSDNRYESVNGNVNRDSRYESANGGRNGRDSRGKTVHGNDDLYEYYGSRDTHEEIVKADSRYESYSRW